LLKAAAEEPDAPWSGAPPSDSAMDEGDDLRPGAAKDEHGCALLSQAAHAFVNDAIDAWRLRLKEAAMKYRAGQQEQQIIS
jgi:hypothetical protein